MSVVVLYSILLYREVSYCRSWPLEVPAEVCLCFLPSKQDCQRILDHRAESLNWMGMLVRKDLYPYGEFERTYYAYSAWESLRDAHIRSQAGPKRWKSTRFALAYFVPASLPLLDYWVERYFAHLEKKGLEKKE